MMPINHPTGGVVIARKRHNLVTARRDGHTVELLRDYGPLRRGQLMELLGLSSSQLAYLSLARLRSEGLVERVIGPRGESLWRLRAANGDRRGTA